MRHRLRHLHDALTERFIAFDVAALQNDLETLLPVDLDVGKMAQCRLCKEKRERQGMPPRQLVVIPMVDAKLFNKKSAVRLCPECDGSALELARKSHNLPAS